MKLDNLSRRLAKLEDKQSWGRTSWRLQDGTKVSFSGLELLAAKYDLMRRMWRAWCGEGLDPLPQPVEALLAASEEERRRVGEVLPWVRDLESYYLEHAENPPEEALQLARESMAKKAGASEEATQ